MKWIVEFEMEELEAKSQIGDQGVGASPLPWREGLAPAIHAGSDAVSFGPGCDPPRVAIRILSEENFQMALKMSKILASARLVTGPENS